MAALFSSSNKIFISFQEIALYGEFSIEETLVYFGWISGLQTWEVKEKLDFLIKFLMLPTPSRLVKNLR